MNGMLSEIKELRPLSKAYFIVMLLLVCSIVFNIAMNSICIITLLAVWLIDKGFQAKWERLRREPFFMLNALFFMLYILGLVLSKNKQNAGFFLTKNLSLIIIPTVMLSVKEWSTAQIHFMLKAFVACVFAQMSVESLLSLIKYIATHDKSYFFYHQLVNNIPIGGAIVASFFCTLSIAMLYYLPIKQKLKGLLYLIFSVWIVLLNSKMFLAVLLFLFIVNGFTKLNSKLKLLVLTCLLAALVLIGSTANPITKRFADMNHFNKSYLTATTFNDGMYFDGLSLRLIYIRFGMEIMKENGNYFTGTGTGDADELLKKKIRAYHMYTGNGTTDKEGYLRFGYHNEYLQKIVQTGILGLLIFLAGIVYCFYMAVKYRNKLWLSIVVIFCCSFFTDTLLEHQVGLVAYLTFSCLCILMIRNQQADQQHQSHQPETNFIKALEIIK